jgi:hypothetical protein
MGMVSGRQGLSLVHDPRRQARRPHPQISETRDAPSEFDEVGVPKPFAIIENGNDLGGDPDQEETFLSGQCVSQDLGKLPEHKLAHAIDLIGVSHWLRRATHERLS